MQYGKLDLMNANQHTSAKGLNYFISVKLLILETNVSQRPWSNPYLKIDVLFGIYIFCVITKFDNFIVKADLLLFSIILNNSKILFSEN